MSESEQDKGPEESAAEPGSSPADREAMDETPSEWPAPGSPSPGLGQDYAPTQTETQEWEAPGPGARPEPAESAVTKEAGDEADAVSHASPPAAKPGEKDDPDEDDPDMKDMAVGPRPADDQAGG